MKKVKTIPQKTVLIVEDEPDTAEMLTEMVQLSGYQVLHTFNGYNALDLITKAKPNALLIDLVLPDISGLEVIRRIRQNKSLLHIPIIIISGNNQPEDIQQGITSGASRYLTKPIGYAELKEALDSAVTQTKPSS